MPTRLLKDSIYASERLNTLTDFQFRLWVNLIPYVDDYGRGDARPAIIKGTCFPLRERLTNADIDAALKALAGAGCVGLYSVDGKPYLYFPRWESHQNVRNKKSKYPAPPKNANNGEQVPANEDRTIHLHENDSNREHLQAFEYKCEQLYSNVPVIQSKSESKSISENNPHLRSKQDATAREEAADSAREVMEFFRDRVNARPSAEVEKALREYAEELTGEVVLHALRFAVDERKTAWSYIRAILDRYRRDGLNSMDRVLESEAAFREGKASRQNRGKAPETYRGEDFTDGWN